MSAVPTAARGASPAARLAVSLAFLVAFLWEVLGAVSNLLAWMQFATLLGRSLSLFAWAVLVVGLLIPLAAFAAAVLVGRSRSAGVLALILAVALCASEALTLSQLAFFQAGIGAL